MSFIDIKICVQLFGNLKYSYIILINIGTIIVVKKICYTTVRVWS